MSKSLPHALRYMKSMEGPMATEEGRDGEEGAAGPQYFRRVMFSPDGSHLLLTYEDHCVRIFPVPTAQEGGKGQPQLKPLSSRIELTSCPISGAWCPFMDQEDNACFITACARAPLQMWDMTDASLRASFVARGDCDELLTPQCTYWQPSGWEIVGGYRKGEMRLFDVTRPGNDAKLKYISKLHTGIISCASFSVHHGVYSLGNYGNMIELFDPRSKTTAGLLRGHQGGVVQTQFPHNSLPNSGCPHHLVTASRGCRDGRILQWDIRFQRQALCSYPRNVKTNQPIHFCCAEMKLSGSSSPFLLSGCGSRTLGLFPLSSQLGGFTPSYFSEDAKHVGRGQNFEEIAPTYSIPMGASVSGMDFVCTKEENKSWVALTTGARTHEIRDQWAENAGKPNAKRPPADCPMKNSSSMPQKESHEWSDVDREKEGSSEESALILVALDSIVKAASSK